MASCTCFACADGTQSSVLHVNSAMHSALNSVLGKFLLHKKNPGPPDDLIKNNPPVVVCLNAMVKDWYLF